MAVMGINDCSSTPMGYLIPLAFDLNVEAARVHQANQKWWHDLHTGEKLVRNVDELLMLMVSEASEAMEGERKSPQPMDDKVLHRLMVEVEIADIMIRALDFAGGFGLHLSSRVIGPSMTDNRAQSLLRIVKELCKVSDSLEQRPDDLASAEYLLSRAITGCFAYANRFGYDILGAYEDKMAVNLTRKDHSIEGRLAAGGKQW